MANETHPCIACGQSDTDPKHVTVLPGHADVRHHHDCGTMMNPPCGLCQALHADFPKASSAKGAGPVKGEQLRNHLMSLPPRLWTHHPDGTVTYEDADGTDDNGVPTFASDRALASAREA